MFYRDFILDIEPRGVSRRFSVDSTDSGDYRLVLIVKVSVAL